MSVLGDFKTIVLLVVRLMLGSELCFDTSFWNGVSLGRLDMGHAPSRLSRFVAGASPPVSAVLGPEGADPTHFGGKLRATLQML
jgi:hypothetical protein